MQLFFETFLGLNRKSSYIFLILVNIFFATSSPITTVVPETSKIVQHSSANTKDSLPVNAYTIDITSCKCVIFDEVCEVMIVKSMLMEINCPDDNNYCCHAVKKSVEDFGNNVNKSNILTSVKLTHSSTKENSTHSIILKESHPIIISSVNGSAEEPMVTSGTTEKPKIKCRCKPRVKCLEKYTDYTFGFHCSYDKVRCCEPESEIRKEKDEALSSNGRIILPQTVTNTKRKNDSSKPDDIYTNTTTFNENDNSDSCICLPVNSCKIDPNTISKRKDTLCPYDLIQCCGQSILRDNTFDTNKRVSTEVSNPESFLIDTPRNGVNIQGQPAFRQPIQLPAMKIPMKNVTGTEESEFTAPTTLPPPQLPTHYFYHQPTHHRGYYQPSNAWNTRPQQPYYTNGRPMYRIHPPGSSERSGQESQTFLQALASLIG